MPQLNNRINLNQHDKDWLFAWSGVKEMGVGDQIANLIGFRIRERRDDIWKMIEYAAARHGMTPESLFNILRVDPTWLKNNPIEDEALPAIEPTTMSSSTLIELLNQVARDREISLIELLKELQSAAESEQ